MSTMERTNYVILYGHKDELLGDISHIRRVINHPVTAGMAQHVVYFLGTHLKVRRWGTEVCECILWTESPAAICTWVDSLSPLACRAEAYGHETLLPFQLIVCGLLLNLLTVLVIYCLYCVLSLLWTALTIAPASLLLCSMADQGPESSVMPSRSALAVGSRGDLYRCLSPSLSNALLLKICCPPMGVFLRVSAARPLMGDLLIW